MRKIKVLFLCTGNSCRSQMAEGWARALKSDSIIPYSAGVAPHGLDPKAIEVLAEAQVDISHQSSKHVDQLKDIDFDFVITVCQNAKESCPVFHGDGVVLHKGFDDPPQLAENANDEEEALRAYRRVREEIKDFVNAMPGVLVKLQRGEL